MVYKYAFKDYNAETMARCVIQSASVSTKHCIEICSHIRGRNAEKARTILSGVIDMKQAIPYRRFNKGVGHRKGRMGPGRYPVKACTEVLKAIESCEANAQSKGLNTDLKIIHICANMASRPWHYGRARRRKMKRTHIEIVLKESEPKKKTAESKVKKPEATIVKKEDAKVEKPKAVKPKTEVKDAKVEKPKIVEKKKPIKTVNAEKPAKTGVKDEPKKDTVTKN